MPKIQSCEKDARNSVEWNRAMVTRLVRLMEEQAATMREQAAVMEDQMTVIMGINDHLSDMVIVQEPVEEG